MIALRLDTLKFTQDFVVSPGLVAGYLRAEGRRASCEGKIFRLGGKTVTAREFYQAANLMRDGAGRPRFRVPGDRRE